MGSFLDYIHFKYIPCDVLVKEVYPLKIVPNFTMIKALAHQVGMRSYWDKITLKSPG
jgi:hypothetical protein